MLGRTGVVVGGSRWTWSAVVLALAARAGAQDLSPEPPDTSAAIGSALGAAGALIDDGDLQGARAALLALVETHAADDALLLQIHRVKELLKRCAFRASHETPEPTTLIAGDLESYDRRTGKIKVRYRRDPNASLGEDEEDAQLNLLLQLLGLKAGVGEGDFTWAAGAPMHPIVFAGPYTVEVKGVMPDKDDDSAIFWSNPQLVVNGGDEGLYVVGFGYPQTAAGWYRTASLTHTLGSSRSVLSEDKGTPLVLGKSYSLKIVVSKDVITASANGRTFLKGKKAGESYGQFGFRGCPGISELIINGTANTAWVEGLEDQWMQEAWTDFDKTYDPLDDLPATLRERFGTRKEVKETTLSEYPGPTLPGQLKHHGQVSRYLDDGDYAQLVKYVEALPAAEVGEGWRNWLMAVGRARQGESTAALELCDALVGAHPDFVPARRLRADLLAARDRDDEAVACLTELVGRGSKDHRVHADLATLLTVLGRYDEARRAMLDAVAAGVPPAELEGAAFMLSRADHGPEWSRPFEAPSRNYLVRTDHSDKLAMDASKALEQSLAMYNRLFGRPDGEGGAQRFEVYIFSGQSSYLAYARDLFGSAPVNTAGLYSPVLKQLLVWNLPDRSAMLQTVRHEGFHQYLDRLVGETASWFNEGTAEYVESATVQRGAMTPGAADINHVLLLTRKDTEWTPLEEFVRLPAGDFYAKAGTHYPQAWAVVHTLLHEGRAERAIFDAYLAALLDGADRTAAADAAFGKVDMAALTRKVKEHVKALKP